MRCSLFDTGRTPDCVASYSKAGTCPICFSSEYATQAFSNVSSVDPRPTALMLLPTSVTAAGGELAASASTCSLCAAGLRVWTGDDSFSLSIHSPSTIYSQIIRSLAIKFGGRVVTIQYGTVSVSLHCYNQPRTMASKRFGRAVRGPG
jgi:hypothetical protein